MQGYAKRAKRKVYFNVLLRAPKRLAEGKACKNFEDRSLVT